MTQLRERFSAYGLWFDLLSPQWLNVTRSWRNEPRIREQFHNSEQLSFVDHLRWYQDRYEPDVAGQVIWVFGDETHGIIGQVSLYNVGVMPGVAVFGRFYVGRDDLLGCGYATRAVRAVVERAFSLGFIRVTLDVKPDNARAISVYRKCGFKYVGVVAGSTAQHMAAVPAGATTHTVIVGSYNRPGYIAHTLRSIVGQAGANWEMLVSDDASSEETLAVIRSFTDRDPRCHLLCAPDQPPPGRRADGNVRAVHRINDALSVATGDVIHYIPDDDLFAPNRFISFETQFNDPNVMMAYGRLQYLDGERPGGFLFPGGLITDPLCQLDQSQVAHRRSCLERVPKWPSDPNVIGYVVDGLFYRALVEAGYGPIRPIDALVSYKRRHAFNMQHTAHESTDRRE